ncbi:phosphate transporter (Pho88) [Coemansia sp. RSA 2399]|nr:phosphate transporter (Pho88) [Coemansia sp. RSA 2399]KAJ1902948.1 phosphate transporter (Pho88) [Coemansia sp. IMI 209127]
MAVIFGTMHIVKKAGLEDPEYMPLIRGVYGVATALMIALVFYLKSTITAKNDTTALEYDDPAPGSQGGRVVTTNVKHDISEIGKLQKSTLLTVGIVIFMHFKFGYIQPLILQTLLPMLNMYKSPLFQIHILGRPATDDLKRPWTPANPFAGFGGGSNANATSEGNDDAQASASSGNDSASDAESTSGKKEKKENEKSEKKGKKGKKETRKDK